MPANTLKEVYDYALSLHGTLYQWGGGHDAETPINFQYGLDCSGFIRKLLSFSKQEPTGDHTSDDYYHFYVGNGHLNAFGLGAMAFFGTTIKIHHIGFCIDDKIMISAAGGGSNIRTPETASRLNAKVKIEPIRMRPDFVCCIMPFYKIPTQ